MSKEQVYVKVFERNSDIVVAVCDRELLGKILIDDEKNINFYVDPTFYGGSLKSIDEALEDIRKATIANLIGNKIVEAAIKEGIILKESVIEISGEKHAQIIMLK
ncbi:MAG: DUF424 family protein [Thermoprotei archaeon]